MRDLFAPGTRYSVIGAARSGIAAANFLAKIGRDVLLTDVKPEAHLAEAGVLDRVDPRVQTRFGANQVREGDVVVISPGIPPRSDTFLMAKAKALELISEVELFAAWHPGPIIAITGTDGKSTTTMLIGEILRAAGLAPFVGGNLGNALTEALPELSPETWVVAEISNAQLITTRRLRPRVAVITNIAEDHLAFHGSFEAYQQAKRRVYQNMGAGDRLVLNAASTYLREWDLPAAVELSWFASGEASTSNPPAAAGTLHAAARFADEAFCLRGAGDRAKDHDERVLDYADFPLPGRHNIENVLAALLAAQAAGAPVEAMARALRQFRGLPHRMEFVGEAQGVRYYNDSKATNAHAAMTGLRGMHRPVVVIAGGYDKGTDQSAFTDLLAERAEAVVLMGATRGALAAAIADRCPVRLEEHLSDAVAAARALAAPGDAVVLSPATSSFDQYVDFEARGDAFRAEVGRFAEPLPADDTSNAP